MLRQPQRATNSNKLQASPAYLSAGQSSDYSARIYLNMSHFSTDSLDDKPCSEAKRSHKRLFPGTLVWPLSNTGVLPARDSTNVKPGFRICVFCFPCTRKSASLEKTHLNSILQREYQDKVGCISSRDLRVLQRLLRVPRSLSCTDTTP